MLQTLSNRKYKNQLTAILNEHINTETRTIVEWGCGLSTAIFCQIIDQKHPLDNSKDRLLLSIHHNKLWLSFCAKNLPFRSYLHLRHYDLPRPTESENKDFLHYPTAPAYLNRKIDLFLIDGKSKSRCIDFAIKTLSKNGTIILCDANKTQSHHLEKHFKQIKKIGKFNIFKEKKAETKTNNRKNEKRLAVIRAMVGDMAEKEAELTRNSVQKYSDRIGAELIDIKKDGDDPNLLLKLSNYETLKKFDRTLLLDTDLHIRDGAPNIFDIVPEGKVGVVLETRYLPRKEWLDRMEEIYGCNRMDADNRASYFNSGVMVLSKQHFCFFDKNLIEENIYGHPRLEQTYLNYLFRKHGVKLHELPAEFNYMDSYYPEFGLDWRFAWFVHLAGARVRREYYEEYYECVDKIHNSRILIPQALAARHDRPPLLQWVSEMSACEHHKSNIFTAANFLASERKRLEWIKESSTLGIHLLSDQSDVVAMATNNALPPGRYRAKVQLRGVAPSMICFDLYGDSGEKPILEKNVYEVSPDNLVYIGFQLPKKINNFVFHFYGAKEGMYFESVTLTDDSNKQYTAFFTALTPAKRVCVSLLDIKGLMRNTKKKLQQFIYPYRISRDAPEMARQALLRKKLISRHGSDQPLLHLQKLSPIDAQGLRTITKQVPERK